MTAGRLPTEQLLTKAICHSQSPPFGPELAMCSRMLCGIRRVSHCTIKGQTHEVLALCPTLRGLTVMRLLRGPITRCPPLSSCD